MDGKYHVGSTLVRYCWAVLAVGVVAIGWSVVPFWLSRPEHQDRFLIPAAALWLAWRQRARFLETPRQPSWLGFALLVPAVLFFTVGWYLQAQIGTRTVLLWWLTLALLAAIAGVIVAQFGWRHAWLLAFPLLFCLLALPTPLRIYVPLQHGLKELATRLAATCLPWLGIPTVRNGFVLSIPSGDMGVAEACSGIRSLSAFVAVALLLAHLRRLAWWRWPLLVAWTFPIVIVVNGTRIVVQGVLQEQLGRVASEGWAHETLGYVSILVTLALVVLISTCFRGAASEPVGPQAPAAPARGPLAAAGLLSLTVVACLWTESQRRDFAENVQLPRLALKLGEWQGQEMAIAPVVPEMLTYDQAVYRVYRNAIGQEIHVWVLFWSSTAHTINTAELHHPDICEPTRGWSIQERSDRSLQGRGCEGSVRASVRHYERTGREKIIFYWTQEGNRVARDEGERQPGDRSGQGWVLEVLRGERSFNPGGRLAILIGAEAWGSAAFTERVMEDFCQSFLPELYAVCPWAEPPKGEG